MLYFTRIGTDMWAEALAYLDPYLKIKFLSFFWRHLYMGPWTATRNLSRELPLCEILINIANNLVCLTKKELFALANIVKNR